MSIAQSQCDRTAAHARAGTADATNPRLVLATCILASSLAFVDGSVVNVALPAIGTALAAAPGGLQWVVDGYLLPLSALLLLGGAAGDRWGRRPLLLSGILVFAMASLACALAPDLATLVAARLCQGCGAAMVMPTRLAVLGDTFSGEARGRAIGIWAASGAIAGAVGPVLGGVLVDGVGWRAVFLINLPVAAAALCLATRTVPATTPRSGQTLDVLGALLATAGLGLVSWGLTEGSGRAGWSVAAIGGMGAGALALLAFLAVERRRGEAAMMPLGLFGSATFTGLTALTLLVYGALGGLFVLLPFVLIQAGGYSALAAGAALLPLPLLIAALSPLAGSLAGRIGPRLPLTLGPVVIAAGFLLMLRVTPAARYWTEVLPALLVLSVGLAGAVAPLTTAVLGSVGADHTGSASGLNSAVARTGGPHRWPDRDRPDRPGAGGDRQLPGARLPRCGGLCGRIVPGRRAGRVPHGHRLPLPDPRCLPPFGGLNRTRAPPRPAWSRGKAAAHPADPWRTAPGQGRVAEPEAGPRRLPSARRLLRRVWLATEPTPGAYR